MLSVVGAWDAVGGKEAPFLMLVSSSAASSPAQTASPVPASGDQAASLAPAGQQQLSLETSPLGGFAVG